MSINQNLIDAICMLDLPRVRALLPGNGTFAMQHSASFLKKLESVFLQLKANGDDSLLAFPGACNSKICDNTGCPGFLFVAVHSDVSFNLIFEDAQCATQCMDFKEHGIAVPRGENISLNHGVFREAKSVAQSGLEYLLLCGRCKEASQDILQFHDRVIDKNYYFSWLEKHQILYDRIKEHQSKDPIRDFGHLYSILESLRTHIGLSEQAREAIMAHPAPEDANRESLSHWCETYEVLWDQLFDCSFEGMNGQNPEQSLAFPLFGLQIASYDFYDVIRFNYLYLETTSNPAEQEEMMV
jgi:hypothetical protein